MKDLLPNSITLDFNRDLHPDEKKFHQDLSACALVGNDLWLRETNRFLIGKIPVVFDPDTGHSELFKTCVHPDDPTQSLQAAQLFGTGAGNMLVEALRKDEHLGRFLAIPCKENGFDIEGIEVIENRVLIGLRGPVLCGWAIIVEVEMERLCDNVLRLVRLGPRKRFYRKHFLNMKGLGIRDLCLIGDDLLILAGPTMDLEGTVRIFRWRNIRKRKKEMILTTEDLELALDFASPEIRAADKNHAEGLTLVDPEKMDRVIVVYDGPGPERQKGKSSVIADIFRLNLG